MVSTKNMLKLLCLVAMILFINLAGASFTDVPPPPKRPDRFRSREELKRYLQKVHEYHSIVGRWRIRRDLGDRLSLKNSDESLFAFFDSNNDGHITRDEFFQRLRPIQVKY